MTQLLIAGVEVVLPQNFSCTVKRENSFFTKSGEYTYDCTLRLDNPINGKLYGFLNRVNKADQLSTDRTAILVADGHVYCRGKEIITHWTEETVTIQIVGGESEMNYFIGQDKKIDELDAGGLSYGMANIGNSVYPIVRTSAGGFMNYERRYEYKVIQTPESIFGGEFARRKILKGGTYQQNIPSPKLCALLSWIIGAMGYSIGVNQLENSSFKDLFILNCKNTTSFKDMLAGWTVKDFLTEVEKLTGCVFVTNNLRKTCDIMFKSTFYYSSRELIINDTADAYEMEVSDDDSRTAEFTTSDVSYELPDHRWSKLMKLPEDLPSTVVERDNLDDVKNTGIILNRRNELLKDTSTGRLYIRSIRSYTNYEGKEVNCKYLQEVDQFADLDRPETSSILELKITPAPMAYLGHPDIEVIDLGTTDGFYPVGSTEFQRKKYDEEWPDEEGEAWEVNESEDENEDTSATFEEVIRNASKKEQSTVDLYCAFYGGCSTDYPYVYTDAYHGQIQSVLYDTAAAFVGLEGSLRLTDIEEDYYQGRYQIDTRKAITFETFDPNVADPRQVYLIRNKRYVVRDIEEVITAEGRQPMWKITCYPVIISDAAMQKRWVLSEGGWDDGAAWLDDGRWNDNPIEN